MNDFKKELQVEQGNMEDIPLEDNTEKDYQKYLQLKRKRELEKPIWEKAMNGGNER